MTACGEVPEFASRYTRHAGIANCYVRGVCVRMCVCGPANSVNTWLATDMCVPLFDSTPGSPSPLSCLGSPCRMLSAR
jgi:hypothetical protein